MSIREVNAVAITDAVEELCIRANTQLPPDVKQALDNAHAAEPWPLARQTLELLQQNLCVAAEKDLPICQDTGMACVFIELGQDVHINGNLDEAVNEGVRRGYEKAYLRKSITADPLQRVNTGDNTPAFLTVHLVPGDVCKITVAPKGAGSENMSRLTMLKPADGVQGVKDFVMETVKQAGANPCPPIVLGIGIGGSHGWLPDSMRRRQLWPTRHCCARWTSPTRTPIMPRWKKSCWMPSMQPALARRALAVQPPVWASALNSCPPMWPACRWQST